MFKGTTGPSSGRTGRSQAEDIGTDPSGFKEGPAYDPKFGVPITKDTPRQEYKPTTLKPSGDGQPIDLETPFTVKR